MRIAILGAGFAGLALCWHLLQWPRTQVTLFDAEGVGGGASGMSGGLLHGYCGPHARKAKNADDALAATRGLLDIASEALGRPVADHTGILRPAVTALQQEEFAACASSDPTLSWWSSQQAQERVPGLASLPALWISEGITVHAKDYLNGLWTACEKLGATFQQERIASLKTLHYDALVIALGAATNHFVRLPIYPVKGQTLTLTWPLPPLPFSLISQGYLIPQDNSCIIGATFERTSTTIAPTPEAEPLLRAKVAAFFPAVHDLPLLSHQAGIRVASHDHRPIAAQVAPKTWAFTALGSKGLLYHAWLAKQLAGDIQALAL